MKKIIIIPVILFLMYNVKAQTITDIDGNTYNVITIGEQAWMKENLKTTHYSNGDFIPKKTMPLSSYPYPSVWYTGGARCYYNYDSVSFASIYGPLYNWLAVIDSRNICPLNWHVPTAEDWGILSNTFGGYNFAGGALKEIGTSHWNNPNLGATNESDFTALPGGCRSGQDAAYYDMGNQAYFWTSTIECESSARFAHLYTYNTTLEFPSYGTGPGFSVRCVMNSSTKINDLMYSNEISLFPNPASSYFDIKLENNNDLKTIKIYTAEGVFVKQEQFTSNQTRIFTNNLSGGLYIVKIETKQGSQFKKVIVVK